MIHHPYSNPASYRYATETHPQNDSVCSINSNVEVDPAAAHSPLPKSNFAHHDRPTYDDMKSFAPSISAESLTTASPNAWSPWAPTSTMISASASMSTDTTMRDFNRNSLIYVSSHPYTYHDTAEVKPHPSWYDDYTAPYAVRRFTTRGHGKVPERTTANTHRRPIIRFSSEQDLPRSKHAGSHAMQNPWPQASTTGRGSVRFSLHTDDARGSTPNIRTVEFNDSRPLGRSQSAPKKTAAPSLSSPADRRATLGGSGGSTRRNAGSVNPRLQAARVTLQDERKEKNRGQNPQPAWRRSLSTRIRRASLRIQRLFRSPSAPPTCRWVADRDPTQAASQLSLT
ncbi:hypothetical protein HGRIS_012051 [Hohenbuehelia grisea]|uniref:Uncharacterized protein n=1 Tax=Hohenbuehelia grisea TaxID=104357 RepID=A0ABR3IR71_9AGAR